MTEADDTRTAFYGTLYTADFEQVGKVLADWVQPGDLAIKVKLLNDEIVYDGPDLYFYCHSAQGSGGSETPYYLLEGHASASLEDSRALLERLLEGCRDAQIECSIDYVTVDEDGDELSEQFTLP
jgi:hypothetical protein